MTADMGGWGEGGNITPNNKFAEEGHLRLCEWGRHVHVYLVH